MALRLPEIRSTLDPSIINDPWEFLGYGHFGVSRDFGEEMEVSSIGAMWSPLIRTIPNQTPVFVSRYNFDLISTERDVPGENLPSEVCRNHMVGDCSSDVCPYLHEQPCERNKAYCLHPDDDKQRMCPREECEMDFSPSMQRIEDEACCICLEDVLAKQPPTERRFGVLENCNHVFCFSCITQWRRSDSDNGFMTQVRKTCPMCRTESNFVAPSNSRVISEEVRKRLIAEYIKRSSNDGTVKNERLQRDPDEEELNNQLFTRSNQNYYSQARVRADVTNPYSHLSLLQFLLSTGGADPEIYFRGLHMA